MSSSKQSNATTVSGDNGLDSQLKDLEDALYEYASKYNSSLAETHPELSTSQRGRLVSAATGSVISSVDPSTTGTQPSHKK